MARKNPKTGSHDRGRFSAHRKTDAVLRLLRGEDLEALSREVGVTAATLSAWRDAFLDGGRAAMRSRPTDDRDELIARLQAKVGQLTMCGPTTHRRAFSDSASCSFRRTGPTLHRGDWWRR